MNKMERQRNVAISEIFESIQWEWRNTWKPSIFVRFWWCNLKCTWCDSKYSWDSTIEKANIMELWDILDQIRWFSSKHIIFTGGEPTLFQKQMLDIQEELWGEWYTYELETNGSQEIIEPLEFQQINISPKLKSSWNDEYKLRIINTYFPKVEKYGYIDFKFVCSNIMDCKETDKYLSYLKRYEGYYTNNIYIMPLGTDSESQVNEYLLKYCIKNNYNYCLRQHVVLFGDKKWV